MSEESFVTESRSSVRVSQNAKGEPVVEVKLYDNYQDEAVDAMQVKAVELFKATVAAVGA